MFQFVPQSVDVGPLAAKHFLFHPQPPQLLLPRGVEHRRHPVQFLLLPKFEDERKLIFPKKKILRLLQDVSK